MATWEHTPRGRGYHTSLSYFHHENDYWTMETGTCNRTNMIDLWVAEDDGFQGEPFSKQKSHNIILRREKFHLGYILTETLGEPKPEPAWVCACTCHAALCFSLYFRKVLGRRLYMSRMRVQACRTHTPPFLYFYIYNTYTCTYTFSHTHNVNTHIHTYIYTFFLCFRSCKEVCKHVPSQSQLHHWYALYCWPCWYSS